MSEPPMEENAEKMRQIQLGWSWPYDSKRFKFTMRFAQIFFNFFAVFPLQMCTRIEHTNQINGIDFRASKIIVADKYIFGAACAVFRMSKRNYR